MAEEIDAQIERLLAELAKAKQERARLLEENRRVLERMMRLLNEHEETLATIDVQKIIDTYKESGGRAH